MIDHTGELMVLRNYYPFGKTWRRSTDPVYYDYYHFNGKEQQTVGDAGLLDYGARFYDPDITRWLTQDPLADVMPNINSYVYCANNPVKFIDPTGMLFRKTDPGNGKNPIDDPNDDSEEYEIPNDDAAYISSVISWHHANEVFASLEELDEAMRSAAGGSTGKASDRPVSLDCYVSDIGTYNLLVDNSLGISRDNHSRRADKFFFYLEMSGNIASMVGLAAEGIGALMVMTGIGAPIGAIVMGAGNIISVLGGVSSLSVAIYRKDTAGIVLNGVSLFVSGGLYSVGRAAKLTVMHEAQLGACFYPYSVMSYAIENNNNN